MLYLKLMSAQNIADSDPAKNFVLVPLSDTTELTFRTDRAQRDSSEGAPATVVCAVLYDRAADSVSEIQLSGNAYVMNENGKTIASHASY